MLKAVKSKDAQHREDKIVQSLVSVIKSEFMLKTIFQSRLSVNDCNEKSKTRNIDQWERTESSEINLQLCGQLMYNKESKNLKWDKDSLQQTLLGKLARHMKKWIALHIKINSKWIKA